ncbi:histidine phosphatase family protein [Paenibacillus pinistramenti]|uniref:histidine phosphatase family protein n=1 Tax=Paenibacillus pinistramenti TaxID=1768003 RepID=UPI0011089D06|nr:histidine phosphatase family protein [Paenibacillus pinistramenti]
MSVHIFLVRHGIKEKVVGDVSITPEGIRQAQLTAHYFSRIHVAEILSSPLRRAVETAQYIALQSGSTIRIDNRLRERANWGDLPGQTFEEFVEMWERCTHEPDYLPPVGDSARQASERLSLLLKEIGDDSSPGSNIVMVTHGGLITDYLVNSCSQRVLNEFHPNFVDNQSSLVSECSITKLQYKNGLFMLEGFADIEHLKL